MVSPLPFFKSFQDFPLATKINPKGLTHQNLYDLASACSYLFCFLNKIHADYFIFWYHLIMWYQPDHDYQAAANFFLSFFKYIRDFFFHHRALTLPLLLTISLGQVSIWLLPSWIDYQPINDDLE